MPKSRLKITFHSSHVVYKCRGALPGQGEEEVLGRSLFSNGPKLSSKLSTEDRSASPTANSMFAGKAEIPLSPLQTQTRIAPVELLPAQAASVFQKRLQKYFVHM